MKTATSTYLFCQAEGPARGPVSMRSSVIPPSFFHSSLLLLFVHSLHFGLLSGYCRVICTDLYKSLVTQHDYDIWGCTNDSAESPKTDIGDHRLVCHSVWSSAVFLLFFLNPTGNSTCFLALITCKYTPIPFNPP